MNRILTTIAVAATVALTGCGDTTEPQRLGEVRIAHVAPGASDAEVNVDERTVLATLPALQFLYRPVTLEPHTYSFESQDYDAQVRAPHEEPITAVILADPADPEARTYALSRNTEVIEQRIMVINADTTDTSLMVTLEGPDTLSVTLAPTEAEVVSPSTGTYDVRVQQGDGESVVITSEAITSGDHGFLVIHPTAADVAMPLGAMLF